MKNFLTLLIFIFALQVQNLQGQTFDECMTPAEIHYYNAFTCDSLTVMVYYDPDISECFDNSFFFSWHKEWVWMGRTPDQEEYFPLSEIMTQPNPLTISPSDYPNGFVDVHICIRAKYNTSFFTNWYKSNHLPVYHHCEELPPCEQDTTVYNYTYIDSTIVNLTYIDSTFITVNYQDTTVYDFSYQDSILWSYTDSTIVIYDTTTQEVILDSLVINYQDTIIYNVTEIDSIEYTFLDSVIINTEEVTVFDTTFEEVIQEVTIIDGQIIDLDSLIATIQEVVYVPEEVEVEVCNQWELVDAYDQPLCILTLYPNPSPDGHFSFDISSNRPMSKVAYWVTDNFGSVFIVYREEDLQGGNYYNSSFILNGQIASTYFLHTRITWVDGTTREVKKKLIIQ